MMKKTQMFTAMILTFLAANTMGLEDMKMREPMPRFIRKLFQKLFDKDDSLPKQKRETNYNNKGTED